jgi:hypothetical protein
VLRVNGETVAGSIDTLMIFDKDLKKRLTWKEEKWHNNQEDANSSQ